jgi:hypothetical protein
MCVSRPAPGFTAGYSRRCSWLCWVDAEIANTCTLSWALGALADRASSVKSGDLRAVHFPAMYSTQIWYIEAHAGLCPTEFARVLGAAHVSLVREASLQVHYTLN